MIRVSCSRAWRSAVAEGGHAVPAERILARYPRTLQHLRAAIPMADLALLYDTSGMGRAGVAGPRLVARWRHAQWLWQAAKPPARARSLRPPATEYEN